MNLHKRTSPVWKFFDTLENDASKARCKLCAACISRGGVGKISTTSALHNHLKFKHPCALKVSISTESSELALFKVYM